MEDIACPKREEKFTLEAVEQTQVAFTHQRMRSNPVSTVECSNMKARSVESRFFVM